jgi:hypothetical protein
VHVFPPNLFPQTRGSIVELLNLLVKCCTHEKAVSRQSID